jgi:hypothetical protein
MKVNIRHRPSENSTEISQRVRQGCPLSSMQFELYMDDIIKGWQITLLDDFLIDDSPLNTLLFPDDQIIFTSIED